MGDTVKLETFGNTTTGNALDTSNDTTPRRGRERTRTRAAPSDACNGSDFVNHEKGERVSTWPSVLFYSRAPRLEGLGALESLWAGWVKRESLTDKTINVKGGTAV